MIDYYKIDLKTQDIRKYLNNYQLKNNLPFHERIKYKLER